MDISHTSVNVCLRVTHNTHVIKYNPSVCGSTSDLFTRFELTSHSCRSSGGRVVKVGCGGGTLLCI